MKDLRPETCYFFGDDPKISLRILSKSSLSETILVDLTLIMLTGIYYWRDDLNIISEQRCKFCVISYFVTGNCTNYHF